MPQDVAQDLAFGARAARALLATPAAVFVQLALKWGRNWAAKWHLLGLWASASGRAAQSASLFISILVAWVQTAAAKNAPALPERCTTRAKPHLRSFNLKLGSLEHQSAKVWSRAQAH